LDYSFTTLKRDRIISQIKPGNLASIRVAERLSMSLQGRCSILIREYLVYGIDRESKKARVLLTEPYLRAHY
jgi:RimJ/RimL family protein N-acetyltransferase